MITKLRILSLLIAVVGCSLSAMARVGNQFEFSTEEADMVFTITSEDPKEVELTEYTRKGDWPFCLTLPETAIDDERNVEFAITSIGPSVFEKTPIREVKFPKTIKKLGLGAFYTTPLLGVDLRGIEEIGSSCFCYNHYTYGMEDRHEYLIEYSGCLQYVVLGSSTKKIGYLAFGHQDMDLKIVSYCTQPSIMDSDFRHYPNITTYVPQGCVDGYLKAQADEKWFVGSTIKEFQDDLLLCGGAREKQREFYVDNSSRNPEIEEKLKKRLIGIDDPCIATYTLCEVNNEFGPQPEPTVRWATSNDNAMITEDGVITGISPGEVYAECYFSLEEPEVTGVVKIPFIFYSLHNQNDVESVETDESAPARIYDLNGREVTGQQLDHGIYIRVTGSHTEKIAL